MSFFLKVCFISFVAFFFALHLISCATSPESSRVSLSSLMDRISPVYLGVMESPYCSKVRHYDSSFLIHGRAYYETREVFFVNGHPDSNTTKDEIQGGLGSPSDPKPIRRAEVKVLDSHSQVVQCSETDEEGGFSFRLPKSYETYHVFVNSRADNFYAKVSVLDAPERKNVYALYSSVEAVSDQNLGTLIATADGDILGGAFNLLDQVVRVNEFIREKKEEDLLNSNSLLPFDFIRDLSRDIESCLFSLPIPKLSVFWEPGFNPNQYNGSNAGKSFYSLNSLGRMFINGGNNGNTTVADTDHFDNSIIIHEISHHINNFCSRIDTPAIGKHDGNSIVDPRLAFEEGFANYFQAVVRGQGNYVDTYGNTDGTTRFKIYAPLDYIPIDCSGISSYTGCDVPRNPGEGNFREFSVTRYLWNHQKEISGGFSHLFALNLSKEHFLRDEYAFRSIGLFHLLSSASLPSKRDTMNQLRENHMHIGSRKEFAQPLFLHPDRSCPMSFSIHPQRILTDRGTFSTSHLLLNNDFFHYRPSLYPYASTLTLRYQTQSGHEADLDLYIYEEYGRLSKQESVLLFSEGESDSNVQTIESESIDISSLSSNSHQDYLINVKVETGGGVGRDPGGPTKYELMLNNKPLCPFGVGRSEGFEIF